MKIRLADKHTDAVNAMELAGEIYYTLLSSVGQRFIPKPHLADAIRQIATGYRVEPYHIPVDMTITGDVLEVSK